MRSLFTSQSRGKGIDLVCSVLLNCCFVSFCMLIVGEQTGIKTLLWLSLPHKKRSGVVCDEDSLALIIVNIYGDRWSSRDSDVCFRGLIKVSRKSQIDDDDDDVDTVSGNVLFSLCAVIKGANKGIGYETVRQLASAGVTVILTARDAKRGSDALSELHGSGLKNVMFHRMDVLDPNSIGSLAEFIQEKFGRLDILVNNAGALGVIVDEDGLLAMNIDPATWLSGKTVNQVQGVIKQSYEVAQKCLETNYYGCRRVTEALLPFLQLSTIGARIVNISSLRGELRRIPGEEIRSVLGDSDNLNEEKLDSIAERFLRDLKENTLEANGWQMMLPAYSISKALLNAYTRVIAKKHPDMCVNCVHPGFVDTDLNWHMGTMTLEEGARGPVMLALLPEGSPSGHYFDQTEITEF